MLKNKGNHIIQYNKVVIINGYGDDEDSKEYNGGQVMWM